MTTHFCSDFRLFEKVIQVYRTKNGAWEFLPHEILHNLIARWRWKPIPIGLGSSATKRRIAERPTYCLCYIQNIPSDESVSLDDVIRDNNSLCILSGDKRLLQSWFPSWPERERKKEFIKRKIFGGLSRDLNPGPRAPEARIIPLDHWAKDIWLNWNCALRNWGIFGILKNFIYFQNGETTMIHFVSWKFIQSSESWDWMKY